MNIWENINIALSGLSSNALRSALTMLGIIIGVLAVILGTAIGQGSREQVLSRIQSLGSNSITIFPGQRRNGPVGGGQGSSVTLKMSDIEAIKRESPTVAPQYQSLAQVKYGNQNTSTTIVSTTPEFLEIRGFSVGTGEFFTHGDVRGNRKVAVIGQMTATNLFGEGAAPIGRELRIRGINFTIVGLLSLKGSAMFGDPDDQIVIPITTGMKQLFGVTNLSNIYAQTANAEDATQASAEIERDKTMPLIEYLYVDERRLNSYFEQISSPVGYDKVLVWNAELSLKGPEAEGTQARFARPSTTHEKVTALMKFFGKEGLGLGRAKSSSVADRRAYFRLEKGKLNPKKHYQLLLVISYSNLGNQFLICSKAQL